MGKALIRLGRKVFSFRKMRLEMQEICPTRRPQVYVSAMETLLNGKLYIDQNALNLLEHLGDLGFDVYWNKEWRPYEIIEREIASSDLMVAIVNSTWASSTWMAIEVTWANGGPGFHHKNDR